jgi:hypothetical protein
MENPKKSLKKLEDKNRNYNMANFKDALKNIHN